MGMKWERTHDGHMTREMQCREYRVDNNHTVLILRTGKTYDSYVMWHDDSGHSSPFLFMFGHEIGTVRYSEIVDMTIRVAPDYYPLFEEA